MVRIKNLLILLVWLSSVVVSHAQISPAPGVSVKDEGTLKGRASSFDFVGSGGVCDIVNGIAVCTWNGVGTGLGEPGSDGIVVRSGTGNTVARTLTGTTGNLVCTNGDGVAANPTCDVGSTIVQTDQGNVYTTGTQNFSAVVVNLPTPFNVAGVSVTATGTELNRVVGVASPIQTQIDTKAPSASPTFTGTVTFPTPFTLGAVSVLPTGTELNFVDGVTSAIQAQIDLKAPLASPTLVTPTIASFVNATHTHLNAAGGGTLTEAALATTDVTTNDATIAKHGFLPKLSNSSAEFMNGQGAWAVPAGGGGGGASNSFETQDAPSGTDPIAESGTDTLNWVATAPVTITGDSTADSITVAVSGASTTAPGVVELATSGETSSGVVVQGNDTRLSNARTPTSHAATHQNGGADEIATATPAANAIPKAGAAGTISDVWIPSTMTRDTELDTFGEWVTLTGIGGTCNSTTFVRGDGTCNVTTGSGDVTSNTSTSVVNEVPLFADTTGKLMKRATGTGFGRLTAGVLSAAELSGDVVTAGSGVATIQPNSVALGFDTIGNYMVNVTGTANEIAVAHTQAPGSTATLSLPTGIDAAKIAGGGVSSAEFNFLSAITSDVQAQINTKAPLVSPTFTGVPTIPTPFNLAGVSVLPTGTELNFVDGVTSAIQAQIDAKAPSASPTLTTPTLITPTIASFTNANHTHLNNAGGGTLTEAALVTTDITTNNTSSTKHGFAPKLSNVATQFLNGQGAWTVPAGGGGTSNSFETQNAPAGTDPVADSGTDTLNWTATAPVTITGDSTTDTLTVAVSDATTTTKGAVELATDGETSSGVVVQGNDARLSNMRIPTAHATSHQHAGTDEIATGTPAANAIPKANSGGTLADGWLATTVTRDTELDSFGEWITFTGVIGACSSATFVRGDGSCSTPTGTGDVASNTATSVVNEIALFADTTGKLVKRSTGTGMNRSTAGVLSAAELSGDVVTAGSNVATIQTDAVALGADTTGNYMVDVTGTANEITVSHTPNQGSTATFSLPTGIAATKIAGGGVSSAEFDFLGTITSNVQTQINTKAPSASPTFTGTVIIPTPFTLGATSVTTTGTQLNYSSDVTSLIQAQLNAKAPSASPTLTTPTLVTPTIASFANANHTHLNNAGGGTLTEAALALTDITTNNATTARHGLLPKLSNTATQFLNGQGAWTTPAGGGGGSSNSFETQAVPSGTNPSAESAADTLNWVATAPITITGDSATDTVTVAVSDASTIAAGVVQLANNGENTSGLAVQASDTTLTRDAEIDTFAEWKTFTGITGTCDIASFVRGDGVCATSVDLDQQDPVSVFTFGHVIPILSTGTTNGIEFCYDANSSGLPCATDGTGGDQLCTIYADAALGMQIVCKPDADVRNNAPSGFDMIDRLGGVEVGRWNHLTNKYDFTGVGRPLKSVEVQGREFGACTYAEAALAASKPISGRMTCTDIDTDGLDFDFRAPLNWNASTITVSLCGASVNATPTGNVVLSCSGQAVSDGDIIANRATTGEQTVTLGLATQYKEECATSAAITITGTPAAGDHLYMHCDIDATGTTATMADMRVSAMAKVFYTVTSTSE